MKSITIEFDGKNIDFYFGLGFLGEVLEATGLDVDDLALKLNQNPYKIVPLMMYNSISWGYIVQNEIIPFTLIEIIEMVEKEGGITSENVQRYLKAFTKSLTKDVPKDDSKKSNSPKKK